MSDFIYTSTLQEVGSLTACVQNIYRIDLPEVIEYHGEWGSLAVSRNLYNGLQPMETSHHIFVVIGGPVLYFQDNLFLTGDDPVRGTKAIYDRWLSGGMQWDEDLSGPFVVLAVDKIARQVVCITDLMSFIPVHRYHQDNTFMLGTHVDALAKAADQDCELDRVSMADFVLNDVVTYPYTLYGNIFQEIPATILTYKANGDQERHTYWLPKEANPYKNIRNAAKALREGLQGYVNRVTENMKEVAQFISAGEDSRALAGLLPQRLNRDAFIFLDSMNREGMIAKRVANAYKMNFHPHFRSSNHYLEILPDASNLIGSGNQYLHAHTLGFHKICGLEYFSAVFGGFLSDTLLKGHHVKKFKGYNKIPFMPQFQDKKFSPVTARMMNFRDFLDSDILDCLLERRYKHQENIRSFRRLSYKEWFNIWPLSMHNDMPNLYANRRLFRTYEPFMAKEVVKISAAVPIAWKLDRRLFNKAARPLLKNSRWLFHADGRLPYFPWWINMPIQCAVWYCRQIGIYIGIKRGNQGPWGDWEHVLSSKAWNDAIEQRRLGFDPMNDVFKVTDLYELFECKQLRIKQKINLMQILHHLSSGKLKKKC
jgi:asparagine synthetase B (glutamine-hydrolysing)